MTPRKADDFKLSDEELEIFELAFLLGMPVYKLISEMPYEEMLGWFDYFKRRPYQWRDDHRASMQIMGTGAKIDPKKVFPSLALMDAGKADDKGLKQSAFFFHMLKAQGGDTPDFMKGDAK